jgi:hypothetical protein
MTVKEIKEQLEQYDENEEVYMFFKTPDGKLQFSSDIQEVSSGAIVDEYGNLVKGVLITRD